MIRLVQTFVVAASVAGALLATAPPAAADLCYPERPDSPPVVCLPYGDDELCLPPGPPLRCMF